MKKASLCNEYSPIVIMGLLPSLYGTSGWGHRQYPGPLGMNIHSFRIQESRFDLPKEYKTDSTLYRYEKPIPKPGEMWEFDTFSVMIITEGSLWSIMGLLGFWEKVELQICFGLVLLFFFGKSWGHVRF